MMLNAVQGTAYLTEGVTVLLQEAVTLVHDLAGIMLDTELRVLHTRADVEGAAAYTIPKCNKRSDTKSAKLT
jgi:hypothetical protein